MEKAYFALGCFWAPEAAFRKFNGVVDTAVGFCGGEIPEPTYHMVCRGQTGHAETVELTFDPDLLPYSELLKIFWNMHNPLQGSQYEVNHKGQYRSAIFCTSEEQMLEAKKSCQELEAEMLRQGLTGLKVSTEIAQLKTFWRAEEYHQQYYAKKGASPTCGA